MTYAGPILLVKKTTGAACSYCLVPAEMRTDQGLGARTVAGAVKMGVKRGAESRIVAETHEGAHDATCRLLTAVLEGGGGILQNLAELFAGERCLTSGGRPTGHIMSIVELVAPMVTPGDLVTSDEGRPPSNHDLSHDKGIDTMRHRGPFSMLTPAALVNTGLLVLAATSVLWACDQRVTAAAELSRDSTDAAELVDRLILESLQTSEVTPAPLTSDEDFLRRVTLDLTGHIPSAAEVTLFSLNPDPRKRERIIETLIESDEFATSWAGYWNNVIFSRATEVRSRGTQPVFLEWMTTQLRDNRPWDEITAELLTATGNTREEGRTALIAAHNGDPAELASEASRIFLGIQMQCANCHDHPYDAWKREDFHHLAAFFPRIRMRREPNDFPGTFLIESADDLPDARQREINPEQLFRFLDRNRDGRLTQREAQQNRQFGARFERLIELADKDDDQAVSLEELTNLPRPNPAQAGRGSAEYYMPDLEEPAARGTRMQPTFFVSHETLPLGTNDVDRRSALASFMTDPDNPWFARAFVNRIWAEMLGSGFYMPIDDLGPEREAHLPEVLEVLTAGFIASNFDMRWVYRTIAMTEAYQRQLNKDATDTTVPFAAATPTRLRPDQVFNSLTEALDGASLAAPRSAGARRFESTGAGRGDLGRAAFQQLFGYDPSTPQEDLMGTIPQALFMMNSPIINSSLNGRGPTMLGRLLRDFQDDDDALAELYLRVLTREPSEAERTICSDHIRLVGDRHQAFEDILWSLLNSSEFLTKR